MEFTATEMTIAVQTLTRNVLASDGRDFDALTRHQQFLALDTTGDRVLPVLVALPSVKIAPGERASYTDKQIAAVVEPCVKRHIAKIHGFAFDDEFERGWAKQPRPVRQAIIATETAFIQAALAAMPVRPLNPTNPDAIEAAAKDFTVPDDLSGL